MLYSPMYHKIPPVMEAGSAQVLRQMWPLRVQTGAKALTRLTNRPRPPGSLSRPPSSLSHPPCSQPHPHPTQPTARATPPHTHSHNHTRATELGSHSGTPCDHHSRQPGLLKAQICPRACPSPLLRAQRGSPQDSGAWSTGRVTRERRQSLPF